MIKAYVSGGFVSVSYRTCHQGGGHFCFSFPYCSGVRCTYSLPRPHAPTLWSNPARVASSGWRESGIAGRIAAWDSWSVEPTPGKKCCPPSPAQPGDGDFFLRPRLTKPGSIRQSHEKVLTRPAPPPSSRSLALDLTHAEFGGRSYASHSPGSLFLTLPTRGSTVCAVISPAS